MTAIRKREERKISHKIPIYCLALLVSLSFQGFPEITRLDPSTPAKPDISMFIPESKSTAAFEDCLKDIPNNVNFTYVNAVVY
ncbi:MAG: hypothetical protein JW705_08550 [Methanosarcinaceae archaeon]|nr:hypothetical protein [Methanosarcinaceae archaeon]